MRMSSIKDVARQAGVSISTVSNVLNKTRYVSPELAAKVEAAAKDLSYEVNPIARSMKKNKTGIIGVITEDICGVFYPYVMRGINQVAHEKGYQIIIGDAQGTYGDKESVKREEELFRRLFANRVDGIIFVSAVSFDMKEKYLGKIKKLANQYKEIPIVSIERNFTAEGIDSVYLDGYSNAIMAVEHLYDCGCRRIGHVAGPEDMEIVQERIRGYKKFMEDKGLPNDPGLIEFGDYSHQSGYTATENLLNRYSDLDGIFCGNDQMAIGALKVLREKGVKVPDDIKLIGYDDVFVSSVVEPSLSTIHVRKRHMGKEAAKILFDRIDEIEKEEKSERADIIGLKMESSLVVRRSTKGQSSEDWKLVDW